MVKLRAGQGKRDDADADTDADDADDADQSNTYMSPFQATQNYSSLLSAMSVRFNCDSFIYFFGVGEISHLCCTITSGHIELL